MKPRARRLCLRAVGEPKVRVHFTSATKVGAEGLDSRRELRGLVARGRKRPPEVCSVPLVLRVRPPTHKKRRDDLSHLVFFGRGGRTRTHDPWFWRPVLYQLSYTPMHPYIILNFSRFVKCFLKKNFLFSFFAISF